MTYIRQIFNSRILKSGVSTVGNVGTGEDDLQTYTLPASTLISTGDSVKIEAQYVIVNNANQKRIKLFFGSATIFDTTATGLATSVSYVVNVEARVFKDGSNTQRYTLNYTATPSSGTAILGTTYGTATQTDTSTITIKGTGETNAASNDDVTMPTLFVKLDLI